LLCCDSFRQPRDGIASVVYGDVDATGFGDGGIHSTLDRGVVGYVQLKDVYWQRMLFRKGSDFGGILGIAASGVTHCRENGMPFTSQGIGEKSAKAGAGTGDDNHLLGIHDHLSLWRLALLRFRELLFIPKLFTV
jgi:hypothetical protein